MNPETRNGQSSYETSDPEKRKNETEREGGTAAKDPRKSLLFVNNNLLICRSWNRKMEARL